MKLLTVVAVAAALALGLSANISGTPSFVAEAQAKGKKAKKGPGMCGTFNYWSKGKCVDTRVTPPKKK